MADIVVSSKKKINFFDRVIQSVVIMLNMGKMNKAIDEHLSVIRKTEGDDKKVYQENILREIVFVKYQYDIMQRSMYDLKMSYPDDIIDNINSSDKTTRLELQKNFLEMEYDDSSPLINSRTIDSFSSYTSKNNTIPKINEKTHKILSFFVNSQLTIILA